MRKNECENRAIFAQICCIFAFATRLQTQRKPLVGIGHFVGHCACNCGNVVSQKRDISFPRHPALNFLKLLDILPPSQLYENNRFRQQLFISTPSFVPFSLPIHNFPYPMLT